MFISKNRHRGASAGAFLAVPLLALSLAACAPGGQEKTESPQTGGSKTDSSETSDTMSWLLDYAECMREQGLDYPDPEEAGGGLMMSTQGDADPEQMQAAAEICEEKLGEAPAPSPEEQAAADKEFLNWAKEAAECYRENGYDMPDPDPNGKTLSFPSDAPPEVMEECGGGQAVSLEEQ
ncbi:hypothetical protein EDF62_0022 [Leucobacter luti]|uniref:Uncharacterized protein n=1 Tax=Leucobacter luti TaxID=340320 RepID=A0A4R6S8Z4_9MICO|nr:hypothetical protein [Leucobacter luti]TDP95345.1 hypothetical protein EDF62_0022 [Leucobacter luti]